MPIGLPSRDLIAALGFGGILEDEAAKLRKSGLQANAQGEQSRAATPAGGPDDEIPMPYQRPRAPSASEPPPYLQMHGATPESLPMPMPTANAMASPQSGAGAPLMSIPPMGTMPNRLGTPAPPMPREGTMGLPAIDSWDGNGIPQGLVQSQWANPRNLEPGAEGMIGPLPDLDAIRRLRTPSHFDLSAGRAPMGPDELQQLQSSPEFEETGTFDFGGPEGASQMFNRVQPEGSLLRDQLENDLILNDRRSGYAGAEGQRAREAKAAAQSGLLDLERNAAKAAGGGISATEKFRQDQLNARADQRTKYQRDRDIRNQALAEAKLKELQKRNTWAAGDAYASQLAKLADLASKEAASHEAGGNFDEAENSRADAMAYVDAYADYVQKNAPGAGSPPPGGGGGTENQITDADVAAQFGIPGATVQMLNEIEAEFGDEIADDTVKEQLRRRVGGAKKAKK